MLPLSINPLTEPTGTARAAVLPTTFYSSCSRGRCDAKKRETLGIRSDHFVIIGFVETETQIRLEGIERAPAKLFPYVIGGN